MLFCAAAGSPSAKPAALNREGAVQVPDLTVLRHVRILRVTERAHIQRSRVPQRPAHVIQALKGDVLIGVAGHHQARLMNLPVERLHRVRPQRPQDVARLILSGQVARLLQFPRQVCAEPRGEASTSHAGFGFPTTASAMGRRGRGSGTVKPSRSRYIMSKAIT